jgi:polypeptide N-acetylgalactosaminyltransferase
MAGGLFAIEQLFFSELGHCDSGLQIWSGKNLEITYKIWQCGTKLLLSLVLVWNMSTVEGWQGNPPPLHAGFSPTFKNYGKVVEVWLDECEDYFYTSCPESKA